ncbi:DUF3145 family protein, partial [Saccharothrix sp. ST-888]|uniref:DUF3145 family protein n=1 Tax=Saccharothrix sp. ST-888 TaxID=1427391 RepID=UPI0012E04F41
MPRPAAQPASAPRRSALKRYEATRQPLATAEGARSHRPPALGIFHAVTGMHGDILI